MNVSSDAKRLTQNTLVLYLKMVITVFFSLYTTRKLLNILGVESFGLFNLIAGILTLLTFFNGAMAMATQRFMSYYKGAGDEQRQSSIFTVSCMMHLGIAIFSAAVLCILGGPIVLHFLNIGIENIENAKKLLALSAITTALSIVSVPFEALITAHEDMLFFAILGVIEAILKLVAVLILFFFKHSNVLIVYGITMPCVYFILFAIKYIYCKIRYPSTKIKFEYFRKDVLNEMGAYAFWSFWGNASSIFANYGQGLLLNRFFGSVVNAAQSISAQLSGQLGALSSTMQRAMNPFIDKSEGAGDRHTMLGASMLTCKYSFFLLLVFYVPLIFKMEILLFFWLGKIPPLTIVFCKLLFIRNLIEQLYTPLVNAISAVGVIKKFQLANSILSLFPLLFVYFLFRAGNPPLTLYVVFILYSIMQGILVVYFSATLCGLHIRDYLKAVVIKCLLVCLLPFLFSFILSKMLVANDTFSLIAYLAICFTATVATIWIIGLSNHNRSFFQSYARNILTKMSVIVNGK